MNERKEYDVKDIYFDKRYGELYEQFEGGKSEVFHFQDKHGEIVNQFIIRKIPIVVDGNKYNDIITPNGYGGPIIIDCLKGKEQELIDAYLNAFTLYCKKNNIVSEFVRFHPLINNAEDFKDIYNLSCIRKTLGTNLELSNDPVQTEFSKSTIKNIKKALKEGVTFEVIENPSDLGDFKEIYYSTMQRNSATKDYYFTNEYFEKILRDFHNNLIIVKAIHDEKTIAQGLYFIFGERIHIHLSGTLSEYLYLSPAYILRYAVTLWGKENGFKIIHHGGGRTNSLEDGLYKFKKGFSKNTEFDFYVGKKIWDKKTYGKLCEMKSIDSTEEYFPAYRLKSIKNSL